MTSQLKPQSLSDPLPNRHDSNRNDHGIYVLIRFAGSVAWAGTDKSGFRVFPVLAEVASIGNVVIVLNRYGYPVPEILLFRHSLHAGLSAMAM